MRIDALAEKSGITVRWKPFLLGPIFAESGWDTSPFNIYEAKGRYMWRDLERLSADQGVPFTRPEAFPQFTLLAARIGVAASDQLWLPDFCRALFAAEYAQGQNITTHEAVISALQSAGAKPQPWLDLAAKPETKQALKDRVTEAQSLGIFGAPTLITPDRELFWGDDRLVAAVAWTAKNPHI